MSGTKTELRLRTAYAYTWDILEHVLLLVCLFVCLGGSQTCSKLASYRWQYLDDIVMSTPVILALNDICIYICI